MYVCIDVGEIYGIFLGKMTLFVRIRLLSVDTTDSITIET